MRYWAYINNTVAGPYETEKLAEVPGFTLETLLSPEFPPDGTNPDWKPASALGISSEPPADKTTETMVSPSKISSESPTETPVESTKAEDPFDQSPALTAEPVPAANVNPFAQFDAPAPKPEPAPFQSEPGISLPEISLKQTDGKGKVDSWGIGSSVDPMTITQIDRRSRESMAADASAHDELQQKIAEIDKSISQIDQMLKSPTARETAGAAGLSLSQPAAIPQTDSKPAEAPQQASQETMPAATNPKFTLAIEDMSKQLTSIISTIDEMRQHITKIHSEISENKKELQDNLATISNRLNTVKAAETAGAGSPARLSVPAGESQAVQPGMKNIEHIGSTVESPSSRFSKNLTARNAAEDSFVAMDRLSTITQNSAQTPPRNTQITITTMPGPKGGAIKKIVRGIFTLVLVVLIAGVTAVILAKYKIIPASLNPLSILASQGVNLPVPGYAPQTSAAPGSDVQTSTDTAAAQAEPQDAATAEIIAAMKQAEILPGKTLEAAIKDTVPKAADSEVVWSIQPEANGVYAITVKTPPANPNGLITAYQFKYDSVNNTMTPENPEAVKL
ncbi:MAG: hypothetical protein WCS77_10310, partial [Elusimicrobiaceae bacterium]